MPPGNNMVRRGALAAISTTLVLALTACAAFGDNTARDSDPGQVSTDIDDVQVTLTLAYADDPPATELVEGFQTLYPNVKFDLQHTSFVDYIDTISQTMSGPNPPDIAQYNPGAMRSLIPGGHLLNLDPYAEAYGWEESFPASTLDTLMLTEDAAQYGTGNLYAAPGALSVLGVFYNTELLEQAGIEEPPTTLSEFEDALTAVDEEGITAFSVGGLETGGNFLWCVAVNAIAEPDAYRDWLHGTPGASIETEGMLEATETLSRWVEAGYVPESANATSDADAQAAFVGGESAFLVTGNWAALALETEMQDEVGFFLMPSPDTDTVVASGSSVAYTVSSATEHPDVAAAFLDYLASPEAARVQVEAGFAPVDTHADTDAYGLLNEVNHGFATAAGADGLVSFPDIAAPGMINQITPGVQGLIAQELDPADFLADLQAEWAEHNDE